MNLINYKNGSTHYLDARMMQVPNIEEFIKFLSQKYKNYTIFEIGTAFGGLTNLLADNFDVVNTFDIKSFVTSFYDHQNIKSSVCDCHNEDFIKSNICPAMTEKNNLFFIDGGDKALEFNLIQNYCKENDILMVHDFSINEIDFNSRGKSIWNCLEVKEEDLNLSKFSKADFFDFALNFAWGAYRKIK
jgi:hypothetical protein